MTEEKTLGLNFSSKHILTLYHNKRISLMTKKYNLILNNICVISEIIYYLCLEVMYLV